MNHLRPSRLSGGIFFFLSVLILTLSGCGKGEPAGNTQSPFSVAIQSPADSTTVSQGSSLDFRCTVQGGRTPYTYLWDFQGASENSTSEDPGQVVLNAPGTFVITLTATDANGLSKSGTVHITVNPLSSWFRDGDGDGYGNPDIMTSAETQPAGYVSNNADCADTNSAVHPGVTDIADNGVDENCDGYDLKTWYRDVDGDGFGNPEQTMPANTKPDGYVANNTDCNDNSASVRPGATDIAGNGVDENCDGYDLKIWYRDVDGDGYGNPNSRVYANTQLAGYVTDSSDCNDSNASVHPGASDIADNGIDENCDGYDLKTWYRDADADGFGNSAVSVHANIQPNGYVADRTDCNDNNASVHPGASDIADNGIDENCDGYDLKTWYRDADGDGYGVSGSTTQANIQPAGYVANNRDCNDGNAAAYPGATDIVGNGIDEDCDGYDLKIWYRDADGDGYGNLSSTTYANMQPSGYVANSKDCNDTNARIHPSGDEVCGDGVDQDCNGSDRLCAGNTLRVPSDYSTIQSAVDAAAPGDTILVADGIYTENVNVYKQVALRSENGYSATTVNAVNASTHIFNVTADYVTLDGFSVYGATAGTGFPYSSGIWLGSGVDHCTIINNRCGYDADHRNVIGISVNSADYNLIRGNTANDNLRTGLFVNTFSDNNRITGNAFSNNVIHGFYLASLNGNNIFTGNAITGNSYGAYLDNASGDFIYLNSFVNNTSRNVYAYGSNCTWNSPSVLVYRYNGKTWSGYLGNYFSDYVTVTGGNDSDGNGVGSAAYTVDATNNDTDPYPLWQEHTQYSQSNVSSLDVGLVAAYPFNGNANDESGNGHHATVYGATLTTDRYGRANSAYVLDGVNDYMDIGNGVKPPFPLTINTWVKLGSMNMPTCIFRNDRFDSSSYRNGVAMLWSPVDRRIIGYEFCGFSASWNRRGISSKDSLDIIGEWHMLSIVYRSLTSIEIYCDGKKIETSWDDGTGSTMSYSSSNGAIGHNINNPNSLPVNQYLKGAVDDIRVYRRALSGSEIMNLFYGENAKQWKLSDGGNNHWYQVVQVSEGVSWTDADTLAENLSGSWHLATLTSSAENTFVYGLIKDTPGFWANHSQGNAYGPWIGAFLDGGNYAWVNGESFVYTHWGSQVTPMEPYVCFLGEQSGQGPDWSDLPDIYPEAQPRGYIIEHVETDNYSRLTSETPELVNMMLSYSGAEFDSVLIAEPHWKISITEGFMEFSFSDPMDFSFEAKGVSDDGAGSTYVDVFVNGVLYWSHYLIDTVWNWFTIAASEFVSGVNTVKIVLTSQAAVWIDQVKALVVPDTFSFTSQVDVAPDTVVTSNTIEVHGITGSVSISIAGADGAYSVNGTSFTQMSGVVENGDTVTVRVTSSSDYATSVSTVLSIGGASSSFTVTTVAAPPNYEVSDLYGNWYFIGFATGAGTPLWSRGLMSVATTGDYTATLLAHNNYPMNFSGILSAIPEGILGDSTSGTFRASLDSDKTVVAGTDNKAAYDSFSRVYIITKKGPSYAVADLAGSWRMVGISTGVDEPSWDRGLLTVDAAGSYTYTGSDHAGSGGFLISADGVVTENDGSNYTYGLDAGKTVMGGTGSRSGSEDFLVVLKQAASYAQADLVGEWEVSIIATEPAAPFWARGPVTIQSDGSYSGTLSQCFNGAVSSAAFAGSLSMGAGGEIVKTDQVDNHVGYMDAGKTVMVFVGNWSSGLPTTADMMILTKMKR